MGLATRKLEKHEIVEHFLSAPWPRAYENSNSPPTRSQVLATNALGNGFMASPAVARAFYLRTKTDLYRVESMPAETK